MTEARRYTIVGEIDPMTAIGKTVAWAGSVSGLDRADGRRNYYTHYDSIAVTEFTDGTAIACVTEHTGPYSEVTPDIDYYTGWFAVKRTA